MREKNIVLLVICVIFLIVCAGFAYFTYQSTEKMEENVTIIDIDGISDGINDFTIYDKNQNEIKLSDYRDSAIYMLFWRTDSEESIEMIKLLEKYYDKYKDSVEIWMICISDNISEPIESIEEFIETNEISINTYYDLNGEAILKYDVKEVPTSVSIDKNHDVLKVKTGISTEDSFEATLDILSDNI